MENQAEKIVGQKCIGYQRERDGKINSVFQNSVKLKNGEVKTDWQIFYSDGTRSLPLDMCPRIDILP